MPFSRIFNVANVSFNAIAKISEFIVYLNHIRHFKGKAGKGYFVKMGKNAVFVHFAHT